MKKYFYAAMLLLGLSIMMVSCIKDDFGSDISRATGKEKGHGYVDLGLPSGTLWATCNIGASSPEEYGDYYAWGETETKTEFSWETYKWRYGYFEDGDPFLIKYVTTDYWGIVDSLTVLTPEDDVAHVKWGGKWRMPTVGEWLELKIRCYWIWVEEEGISGWQACGPNQKTIFFPVDHTSSYTIYWSSNGSNMDAHSLDFSQEYVGYFLGGDWNDRYIGSLVRPVMNKNH